MTDDDLWQSDQDAAEERERRSRYDDYIRCLHDVVATAAGQTVILWLLRRTGVDGPCSEDPRLVRQRNEGLRLLDEIAYAAPTQWQNIIVALRGHPKLNEDTNA